MLTDYTNVIAPTIAVVNSVIAVSVSHFKPEKYRAKVILLCVSIILGLIAVGATIYGQYTVVSRQEAESSRKADIHVKFGEFISRGDAIMSVIKDSDKPLPDHKDVEMWVLQVEQYLQEHVGAGYVERFRDSSGISHGRPIGIDIERANYWATIYDGVTRLQEFSSELSK